MILWTDNEIGGQRASRASFAPTLARPASNTTTGRAYPYPDAEAAVRRNALILRLKQAAYDPEETKRLVRKARAAAKVREKYS